MVYLAGHFLHLINCRQQDLLCYSLFLSGKDSYFQYFVLFFVVVCIFLLGLVVFFSVVVCFILGLVLCCCVLFFVRVSLLFLFCLVFLIVLGFVFFLVRVSFVFV